MGPRIVLSGAAVRPAVVEYDSGMTENKSRRGLLAAVVVLVVLLGGAALIPLLIGGDDDGGQATPSKTGTDRPSATTSAGVAEPVQPPLTTAPEGVTWELFEGVAVPSSRTDGPTRVDGPVQAGFSRTPTGALLADAQISIRTLVDRDVADLLTVAEAQLVDGPGKTAYLNLISQLEVNDPPATGYAQIAGFRYITYTADLAVISRATRDQSGRIQVSSDTLRWIDGDWKLDKPATGLQQPQVVQDLTGYVPWSGIS